MGVRSAMRYGRGLVLLMAVLLGFLTGCGGSATGGPQVSTRPVTPSPRPGATTVLDRSCPSPTSAATPAPDDTKAHGWPDGGRNPAGVYSWGEVYSSVGRLPKESGSHEKQTFSSTNRWMHNGYAPGSGDVNITFEGVPGQLIPHRGQCAVTVKRTGRLLF
jgi:hypothetical protein